MLPSPGLILTPVGMYGLMFLTYKLANKPSGILAAFAFTGFLGYIPGANAERLPVRRHGRFDRSGAGRHRAGLLLLLGLRVDDAQRHVLPRRHADGGRGGRSDWYGGEHLPATAGSASGHQRGVHPYLFRRDFCFETSNIIRGGETNYIRATVSLYVSLYNIFVSLLSILGFASRD